MSRLEPLIAIFVGWPRWLKQVAQIVSDCMAVGAAMLLVMVLADQTYPLGIYSGCLVVTATVFVAVLWLLGAYRAVVRFIHSSVAITLLVAAILASAVFFFVGHFLFDPIDIQLAVNFGLVSVVLAAAPRMVFGHLARLAEHGAGAPAVIYGAGKAGRMLAAALVNLGGYRLVGYVDDRNELQGATINNVPVFPPSQLKQWAAEQTIEFVLLALPSAKADRRREIVRWLSEMNLHVRAVPELTNILQGSAKITELREIQAEELLGREPIPPFPDLMAEHVRGKNVMVTGAGGTIGAELCRQLLAFEPQKLILFERSELALYTVDKEFKGLFESDQKETEVVSVLGCVTEKSTVADCIKQHAICTVYHAAAYKHVPIVEENPGRGMRNNIIGSMHCAEAAAEAGVGAFVFVSTDKAVRPTSLMGASKRVAEIYIQSLARRYHNTAFSIVRFGNVLGSSGSVIPHFQQQIAKGGPVTVTDMKMSRYFMTIPEAAQLVIQAGALAAGGECKVLVLHMGEPVRIYALAESMIRLLGYQPRAMDDDRPGIKIKITGRRKGEKLYEELLTEHAEATCHPRILICHEPEMEFPAVEALITALCEQFKGSGEGIKAILEGCSLINYREFDRRSASRVKLPDYVDVTKLRRNADENRREAGDGSDAQIGDEHSG